MCVNSKRAQNRDSRFNSAANNRDSIVRVTLISELICFLKKSAVRLYHNVGVCVQSSPTQLSVNCLVRDASVILAFPSAALSFV